MKSLIQKTLKLITCKMSKLFLLLLLLLSNLSSNAQITPDVNGTVYVKPTATGTGTGNSWANASNNIQNAINAPGAIKVFVSIGTYHESNVSMKDGVEIYGGFDPDNGIDSLSDNRILPSATNFSVGSIINADGANHVIHNSFVDVSNTTAYTATLLDGFTLTGAESESYGLSGPDDPNALGGGIYIHNSSSRFNNLVIRDNFSYMGGGGVAVDSNSLVLITNSYIIRNSGDQSAPGIYVNQYCDVIVQNVEISRNTTGWANQFNATAISAQVFSDVHLNNVTITNNTTNNPTSDDRSITTVNFAKVYIKNSLVIGQKTEVYIPGGAGIGTIVDIKSSIVNRGDGLKYYDVSGNDSLVTFTPENIFSDPANKVFTPNGSGPAVNTGANIYYPGLNSVTKDLLGHSRLVQDSVDMGAYEFNLYPDSNNIIYVKAIATGTGMGDSWSNATSFLHYAIHIPNVQKVFVAKGTYHVGDNSFIMKNNVGIYGGFDPDNGIIDLADNRILPGKDFQLQGSILDGDYARPVIWNDYTASSPLNSTAILDGFTLTHAAGTANNGCIYNNYASPTLTHLRIQNNTNAGIYNSSSSPDIYNTAIVNNMSSNARGIYQNGGSTALYNVTIAGNAGGAIVNADGWIMINNSIVFGAITGNGLNMPTAYSFIQDNALSGPGNANASGYVTTDVFQSVTTGDYRLRYVSPAVNSGNNGYLPGLNSASIDLNGKPRVMYGIIDMGAYESFIFPDSMGVVYVKPTATGSGSGNSWANATNKLQYAIDAQEVQKVFVAVGNYNIPSSSTSYVMKNNVALYGGFDPDNGIDNLSDIRIVNDTSATTGSILNGMFQKPVIWNYCTTTSPMNNTAILDGFTIINGRNLGNNAGGIMNRYASPKLKNLVIKNNKAAYGGGIYNIYSSPQISQVAFINDSATYSGGGVYNESGAPSFRNLIFKNNVATITSGGGIYHSIGNPSFNKLLFENNKAGVRGGGLCIQSGVGTMDSLTIVGNFSGDLGAGFYNQSGVYTLNHLVLNNNNAWTNGAGIYNNGSLTINQAIVDGNFTTSGNGGGIFNATGNITFTDLDLKNNNAAYDGGGLYNSNGTININNTTVKGNIAGNNGGAIYNNDTFLVAFTTFDSNAATLSGGFLYNDNGLVNGQSVFVKNNVAASSGGVFSNNARSNFLNTVIFNNTNGGFTQDGDTSSLINCTISGNDNFGLSTLIGYVKIYNSIVFGVNGNNYQPLYSLIEGNTDFSNGNIDASAVLPSDLFINPTNGDFHLLHNTVVWDKGQNELFPNLDRYSTVGMYGNEQRLIGQNIEMGAYEYQLNADGNAVMYVKDSTIGTGDGASWANATSKLQDAIDANGVQQVWVAKGLYKTGNRSFIMKSDVGIYGGFDPDNGIDNITQNRIMPDTSGIVGAVLDGENQRPVFWHYCPSYQKRLKNAVLDGFTIRNGYNAGNGAGMVNGNEAYPTLSNIVFKNNHANSNGGGMYNSHSTATLSNVAFLNNVANSGGGICNDEEGAVNINKASFLYNAAVGGQGTGLSDEIGGALCNMGIGSAINASNIILQHNSAFKGAAIGNYTGSATITNGLITDNFSDMKGAVYIRTNSLQLNNVTIANNINDQYFGNVYIETDTMEMIEPYFYELYGILSYQSYTFPYLYLNNCIVYDNFNPYSIDVSPNHLIRKNTLHKFGGYSFPLNSGASTGNTYYSNIADVFVSPSTGDYRLKQNSPVIDMGNNSLFPSLNNSSTDIAGNPRVYQSTIDMGAYEYQGIPMPVKLLSFTAQKQNKTSFLQWATASEQNNQGFFIERSANSKDWEIIGFQKSLSENGNSAQTLNYQFVDEQPFIGNNFYRLKQIDFDEGYEYSPVRLLAFDRENEIKIYPNPAKEQVTIGGLQGDETISVSDVLGKEILKQNAEISSTSIQLNKLIDGIYFIKITNSNHQDAIFKVVVQK